MSSDREELSQGTLEGEELLEPMYKSGAEVMAKGQEERLPAAEVSG
jgi:hypothetical protein